MHDKVKKHWAAETARVQKELGELAYQPRGGEMTPEQARRDLRMAELKQRLEVLTTHRHGADRLAGAERDRSRCRSSASTSCRTASG